MSAAGFGVREQRSGLLCGLGRPPLRRLVIGSRVHAWGIQGCFRRKRGGWGGERLPTSQRFWITPYGQARSQYQSEDYMYIVSQGAHPKGGPSVLLVLDVSQGSKFKGLTLPRSNRTPSLHTLKDCCLSSA